MPSKKIVLEKMPSGAQQWVRGKDRYGKSNTLGDYEQNELDEMKKSKLDAENFLSHTDKFSKFSHARSDNSDQWDKEMDENKYANDFGEEGQVGKKRGGAVMSHDHGHKPMAKMSHGGHYCWGGKAMKKAEGGMAKGGNWIQGAIKKPGALKKSLGVPMDKPIPAGKLKTASKAPGKMGQRARLAMTLKGMK